MTKPVLDEAARKLRHRKERIAATILVLVLGAIVAAIAWWSHWEGEQLERDKRYIPRATAITPEILLLQEFVRIDTSHPAGAAAGARWLAAYLRKNGVAAEVIEAAPDRLNVYARIRGTNRGDGLVLFNHIDVVPPGEHWSTAPFAGNIAANMLFGRGSLDMKALTICQMLAFVQIARSGQTPAHDLVFLATADEETGSEFGMRWILAHRPDVLADVRFGITEGGVTEMMTEHMTYFGIEVGGKQEVVFELQGDDLEAMQKARFAFEPYMFSREPERVLPVVRQFFGNLAPTRTAFKPFLSDIDATIRQGQFWRLPAPYRDLTQNSLWVTAPVRAGNRWTMSVTQLNLPDESPDARIAAVEAIARPYGLRLGTVRTKQGPVPASPSDTKLFRILEQEAERRYKVEAGLQILYRSGTDARFLRPRGIVCYGVTPYPVDYFQSLSIHGPDERIRLDYFTDGVEYLGQVIDTWAFRE